MAWVAPSRESCHGLRTLALSAALVAALLGAALPTHAERITLEDRRTAFQRLTVIEDTQRHERYLYSDDQRYMQGMLSLRRPDDLGPAYLRSALLGLIFAPASPSAMLFVGLGTGSLPRYLSTRYPRTRLDAVEIDPAVPRVARRHFALPSTPRLKVIVREGRDFIRAQTQKYDLVLMDAYFGAEIPPSLATIEFMAELRGVLQPAGIVVANLPAPALAENFWSVLATYRAAFANVRVFATESPVNFILVASSADLVPDAATMQQRIQQLKTQHRIDVNLDRLASMAPPWGAAPVAAPELHDAPPR